MEVIVFMVVSSWSYTYICTDVGLVLAREPINVYFGIMMWALNTWDNFGSFHPSIPWDLA
jgi:hypothetical protein